MVNEKDLEKVATLDTIQAQAAYVISSEVLRTCHYDEIVSKVMIRFKQRSIWRSPTIWEHTEKNVRSSVWHVEAPLETIQNPLRHEDTKTTIEYQGINTDSKSGAMNQLAEFQKFWESRPSQHEWWTDRDLSMVKLSGMGRKMP